MKGGENMKNKNVSMTAVVVVSLIVAVVASVATSLIIGQGGVSFAPIDATTGAWNAYKVDQNFQIDRVGTSSAALYLNDWPRQNMARVMQTDGQPLQIIQENGIKLQVGDWSNPIDALIVNPDGSVLVKESLEFSSNISEHGGYGNLKTTFSVAGFHQEYNAQSNNVTQSFENYFGGDNLVMKVSGENYQSRVSLGHGLVSLTSDNSSSALSGEYLTFCSGNNCIYCYPDFNSKALSCR